MSVTLSAHELTQLVNRFLTAMSGAILDSGGTIDKYIGDCVMAFWNVPLDDPARTAGLQGRAIHAGAAAPTQ